MWIKTEPVLKEREEEEALKSSMHIGVFSFSSSSSSNSKNMYYNKSSGMSSSYYRIYSKGVLKSHYYKSPELLFRYWIMSTYNQLSCLYSILSQFCSSIFSNKHKCAFLIFFLFFQMLQFLFF